MPCPINIDPKKAEIRSGTGTREQLDIDILTFDRKHGVSNLMPAGGEALKSVGLTWD